MGLTVALSKSIFYTEFCVGSMLATIINQLLIFQIWDWFKLLWCARWMHSKESSEHWNWEEKITETELAQTEIETHQFPNKFHTKWNNEKNKNQMSKHSANMPIVPFKCALSKTAFIENRFETECHQLHANSRLLATVY